MYLCICICIIYILYTNSFDFSSRNVSESSDDCSDSFIQFTSSSRAKKALTINNSSGGDEGGEVEEYEEVDWEDEDEDFSPGLSPPSDGDCVSSLVLCQKLYSICISKYLS